MANLLPPVVAELKANISDFSAKMRTARGEMAQVESSAKSNFGALKAAGVLGFAALSAAAVKWGKGAIHEAVEGQKANTNWATSIRNARQPVEELLHKTESMTNAMALLGLTNDDVEITLTKLTQGTGSTTKAFDNLGLVVDFAKAKNVSLATAANTVSKVLNGNIGVLSKMAIATKDAAGNTLTAEAAIKMLQERFGGAAQAQADTYAGKLTALSAQYSNFKETVGNALLPVLTQLASIVQTLLGWFTSLDAGTQKLITQFVVFGAMALAAVKAFTMIKAAVIGLGITIDVALPELALLAAGIAVIVTAYHLLKGGSGDAKTSTEDVAKSVKNLGQAAADTGRILEDLQPIAKGKFGDPDQMEHMTKMIDHLGLSSDETAQLISNLNNPTRLFTEGMSKFSPKAQQAARDLQNLTNAAGQMDPVVHNANESMDETVPVVENLGNSVDVAFYKLINLGNGMSAAAYAAQQLAEKIKSAYSEIRAQFDVRFNADKSLLEFRNGLKGLAKELETLKPDSLEYRVIIDQQTDSALKAAEAFAEMDIKNRNLSGAMADAARNKDMLVMLQNLRKEATNPALQSQLDGLIAKLQAIPGNYQATVKVDYVVQTFGIPGVAGLNRTSGRRRSTGIPGLAGGGRVVADDAYMVGENGPELFVSDKSGSIIPNNKLSKGTGVNVVQHFHGVTADSDLARRASRELGWALRAA